MKSETTNIHALYVHFPFCAHLCHYCDFAKLLDHSPSRAGFLSTVKSEIQAAPLNALTSVYWGGGTPTVHTSEELQSLAELIRPLLSTNYEWTVEVNPETVTYEKLKALYEMGINRLSIGVQAIQPHLLERLGRHHTHADVIHVIEWARLVGFTNYSFDLMVGLPGQTVADVMESVVMLLSLQPTHLSLYALTIEPHTPFHLQGVQPPDDDLVRDMYDVVERYLEERGWEHYEISNFAATPQYRSRHNLVYWTYQPYWAVGPGAHGFTGSQRYENKRNFTRYFQGDIRQEWTTLSRYDQQFEYIMLALRLSDGLSLLDYEAHFHEDFTKRFAPAIQALVDKNLVELTNTHLKTTKNGMMIVHSIILELTQCLDEEESHAPSRL